ARRLAARRGGASSATHRFADTGNRSPKIIVVFPFPHRDSSIGHSDIDQCEQPSQLQRAQFGLVSDVNSDLVVQAGRSTEAWCSVIRPEGPNEGLFGRALRCRGSAIASKFFYFVVGCGIR